MKKSFILATVLVAALTSCQKEVQEIREAGEGAVRATREVFADTKAALDQEGKFTWITDDAMAIYDGSSKWNKFVTKKGGSASADFYLDGSFGKVNKAGYAVYPYALGPKLASDALSVTLPTEYDWVENQTNVPMLATIEDADASLSMKHLGGVVRVTVNGMPEAAGSLVFWADKAIAGEFKVVEVEGEQYPVIKTADKAAETPVTISFKASDVPASGSMNFYIPVPVGDYKFNLTLKSDAFSDKTLNGSTVNSVKRCDFLRMAALDIDSATGSGDGVETNVNVSETYESAKTINLPATKADVNVFFNADQTADAITLDYDALGDKPENVYIYAKGEEGTIDYLTINLPESHVTLVSGSYGTVVASTSSSTLVVSKDVAITTSLTVNQGSLEFYGKTNKLAAVTMDSAGSSIKLGEYDSTTGNGYIQTLTLTRCANAEIAGTVATIDGSAATEVLVKTTGTVSASDNSALIVYVEKDGSNAGVFTPDSPSGCASKTVLNLSGLQGKINAAVKNTPVELSENYSGEFTVATGKDVTINFSSYTVFGKFIVEEGATLTLKGGSGKLNSGADGCIIENHGTVALENTVAYSGSVKNNGKLTVGTQVALAEVVEADGSKTAYVNNTTTFNEAVANADIAKVVLTKAVTGAGNVSIGSSSDNVAQKTVVIDLNGYDYTANTGVNAFTIRNAKVNFINSGSVATIEGGSGNSALVLNGAGNAVADYTVVDLGEKVKLAGQKAISVGSPYYGIVVNSVADMSTVTGYGIYFNAGSAAKVDHAPVFKLNGGSVKNIFSNGKYAKWYLEGVTVGSSSENTAISLGIGDMEIVGKEVAGVETTKVLSSTTAISCAGAAANISLAIKGGEFSGAISASVKDFISGGTFDHISAANLGAENVTVNIKLKASTTPEVLTVKKDKSVKLDLNGNVVSNAITVDLGGTLVVNDTPKTATVTSFTNNGTATLNGGTYTKIVNRGKLMTINKGVEMAAGGAVENGYSDYSSYSESTNAAAPELVIEGGEFRVTASAPTIKNLAGGVLKIKDGTFESSGSGGMCVENKHEAFIYGGDFTASGSATAVIKSVGEADETFATVDEHQKGEITLSGTVFKGSLVGPTASEYGKIAIEGGEYSVDPTQYVDTKTYTVTHVELSEGVAERWTVSKK